MSAFPVLNLVDNGALPAYQVTTSVHRYFNRLQNEYYKGAGERCFENGQNYLKAQLSMSFLPTSIQLRQKLVMFLVMKL